MLAYNADPFVGRDNLVVRHRGPDGGTNESRRHQEEHVMDGVAYAQRYYKLRCDGDVLARLITAT